MDINFNPDQHVDSLIISRRDLLRICSAVSAALLLLPMATMGAQLSDNRSLSFVHTHTGEKLSITYWRDGVYQTDYIAELNHFLRDFRTNEVANMDRQLLDILYDLKVRADHDAAYEVISAYRSPQTNANLRERSSGVSEHSLHMEGRAMDVRLQGFDTEKLQQLALSAQRGGVGFYAKSNFLHLDTGRVRAWIG